MIPYRYLQDFAEDIKAVAISIDYPPLRESSLFNKFGCENFIYYLALHISEAAAVLPRDLDEIQFMQIVSDMLEVQLQVLHASQRPDSTEIEYAFVNAFAKMGKGLQSVFCSIVTDMFKDVFVNDKHNLALDRVADLELSGRHKVKFYEAVATHPEMAHPRFKMFVAGNQGGGFMRYAKSLRGDLEFDDVESYVRLNVRKGPAQDKMMLIFKECFIKASKLENISLLPRIGGGLEKFILSFGNEDTFKSFVGDKKYNFEFLHVQISDVKQAIEGIDAYLHSVDLKSLSSSDLVRMIPIGRRSVTRELKPEAQANLGDVLKDYLSYCFAEAAQNPKVISNNLDKRLGSKKEL